MEDVEAIRKRYRPEPIKTLFVGDLPRPAGRSSIAAAVTVREAVFDRLDWQMAQLRGDLERCARFTDEGVAIIAELAAIASGAGCR